MLVAFKKKTPNTPEEVGAASAGHTHDEHYTKEEADQLLTQKANVSVLGTQCTFTLSGTTLTITPK